MQPPPLAPAVTVRPIVQRYFHVAAEPIALTGETLLRADQFVNDHGEPTAAFPEYREQGYYNLYVNGLLQEGQVYSVASQALRLMPTGETILAGTPVILESVGFVIEAA